MARREEKPAAPDDTRRFDIFHNTDTDVYANLEECREELKHLCENSSFEGTEVILEINKRLAELNDVPEGTEVILEINKRLAELNDVPEGTEVILEINKRLAELNDVPDLSCMSMAGRRGGED